MTSDDAVERALAEVADADASRHAPPHLEHAIMAALDRQMHGRHFWRWAETVVPHRYAAAAITVIAMAATTIAVVVWGPAVAPRPLAPPDAPPTPVETRSDQAGTDAMPAVQLAGYDFSERVLVRLPRHMLPMLGVPIINPDAPGTVNLEVILHADGLANTIRIVP